MNDNDILNENEILISRGLALGDDFVFELVGMIAVRLFRFFIFNLRILQLLLFLDNHKLSIKQIFKLYCFYSQKQHLVFKEHSLEFLAELYISLFSIREI